MMRHKHESETEISERINRMTDIIDNFNSETTSKEDRDLYIRLEIATQKSIRETEKETKNENPGLLND